MTTLEDRLLAAHGAGDAARLATLYAEAADVAEDEDAAGFYLTHAYVFALDANTPDAQTLRHRLIAMGRETPI